MEILNQKPLKILNASAGSGKTFNLVKEYIVLLLSEKNNATRFSNIIAMTFTNKAALEMKSRIIQALDELSFPSKYKQKSDEYALLISGEIGINPEEVHTRAQIVLKTILHRYEDFHVMTIDKFNLKLIRSFSRDLNLPNDFEIILNETEVIEKVVDSMMNQLGQKDLEKLTQLVFSYAKENIEAGEKWDFRQNLIKFAEILKKENYFELVEELLEADFSNVTYKSLKFEKDRLNDIFIGKCQQVYQSYVNLNLIEKDLPGGSRTSGPITKLSSYAEIPNELFTEAFIRTCNDETPSNKTFPEELKKELVSLFNEWKSSLPSYTSLSLYLKNFHNMALLQFMGKQLQDIRKDEQLIRISEFNKLISELVKNEDAPFIYERLGTRFQHFLLDEFQDTSHLQWLNMVPLIHESISQDHKNLIVGDPKQSIYRFKNGVAEQFVALPEIYNPQNDLKIQERSSYFSKMGEMFPLEDNWRSSSTIVEFNNQFFEHLKKELNEEFQPFYNSIYQNPKSKKEGYIEIISQLVEKEGTEDSEITQMIDWINQCEKQGFKRGDICILGATNKDCSRWAVALNDKKYEVVSADSLFVDSSPTVQLTIAYLKRRLNPLSENERRKFAEKFFRIYPENGYLKFKSYLIEFENQTTGKKYKKFNDEKFIADFFKSSSLFFEKYENIYDLVQKFFQLLNLNELENPYLHHLADIAHEFDLNNGPDLKKFIDNYQSNGKKSAVQLPESENAIRIMSIHKSKGLEFPIVILPRLNFKLNINGQSKFLVKDKDKILYTSQKKESPIEAIRAITISETGQTITDSINVCYVAMTRPIERLYILNQFTKEKSFGTIFNEIITQFENTSIDENSIILKRGVEKDRIQSSGKIDDNQSYFVPKNISDKLWFPDISLQDKEELRTTNQLTDAQRYGNQLHLAISILNKENDNISSTVEQLNKEGLVEHEFIHQLKKDIHSIFSTSDYTNLLKNSIEILNEQAIIASKNEILRPDKIIIKENQTLVVDFKTGLPNNKYAKQIKNYALTLKEMGYPNVEGYLFYTSTLQLEQVI